MITKIEKLKNIGNFEDYTASGDVTLKRMSIIYAENGAGKTTLSQVLHSLATNNPEIIKRHTRIGATGTPEAIFNDDTGHQHNFNGTRWNRPLPELEVFDAHFVANNVYSGFDVTNDQQKKLYQFVVGDTGVELIRKIERVKGLIESIKWLKDQKDAAIVAASNGIDAATVCKMKPVDKIDELIAAKEKELSVAKNQEKIKKQARPQVIVPNTISFDAEKAQAVLAQTVEGIGQDYLDMVKRQLAHLKEEGVDAPTKWVENGMYGMENGLCPFCGQPLDGLDLIKGYNQYFSDNYKAAVSRVEAMRREFRSINIEAYLQKLETDYKAIVAAMELWKELVPVDDKNPLPALSVDGNELKVKYEALKNAVESKTADPVGAVDIRALVDFMAILSNVQERVKAINDYVTAYVKRIEDLCANIGDATEVQKAYDSLVLNKKRFEEPLAGLCHYSAILGKRLSKVKGYNTTYQQQLKNTSNALFQQYGTKINYYLDQVFMTPFKIQSIWSGSYAGRQKEPKLEYVLTYNGTEIELAGDGNKSFKNVLSEGDKNTIAFSFFLAKLTEDAHYTDKIVVFDDPLTSLDQNRRLATIDQLVKLYNECKQVIVLSHNLHFLVDLNGRNDMRRADKKVVMIVKGINAARIERWELKREWMDKYKQSILKMEDFVNNPHPDKQEDAINGIRLTLELMLKLKFCKYLSDQNGTLGDLIADLEHSACTFVNNNKADVIAKLKNLNEASWRTHHASVEERAVYHEVTLTMAAAVGYVNKALQMLQNEL